MIEYIILIILNISMLAVLIATGYAIIVIFETKLQNQTIETIKNETYQKIC